MVDSITGQAVKDATLVLDGKTLAADDQGVFSFSTSKGGGKLGVKAPGYQRVEQTLTDELPEGLMEIRLAPFSPRALYLSFYGVGSKALRDPALKMIEETELNALVIDVKGDRGMIPYRSTVPLAAEVGGQRIITVRDIDGLLASFKEKGIYTIARIVVFKDDLLATARPDLAVKTPTGEPWRDRERLAWVDPFRQEVWNYNIQIAEEAAKLGFDEIQFDYVRFPDSRSPRFSQPSTEDGRVKAIAGFLQEAKARLAPYNVFVAADIFGYVCWNLNDTDIGQKLDPIASAVDYLSPMLYPSGFQFGIPGYRNPVQNPYEIVYLSLKKAQERSKISPLRFRPWLQAFKDYAFDRRQFNGKELRDQIAASEKFGSQGWMLWNPVNQYTATAESLKKEMRTASVGPIASNP
ncbi:MAG: putative glycoside hydrolase [Desulfobacterales bacterium]|nr:putative glycoside hydrolase [Desulfobacterales bacterium]